MRIFLSYASEDKAVAEAIAFSLRARNHTVFLDRDDLPAGGEYDRRIEQAVSQAGLLVFLISPASVARGRFTLTELEFARRNWRKADGHVLPVMIAPTAMTEVPGFLKSVTILEPKGNAAAEVASAVDAMAVSTVRTGTLVFGALGLVSGVLTEPALRLLPDMGDASIGVVPVPFWLVGILFGIALLAALCWQFNINMRRASIILIVMVAWYLALLVFIERERHPDGQIIDIPSSELVEKCKQLSEGQISADAALEKSCLELKLKDARSELAGARSYYQEMLSFSLSGAVGALITVLGVPLATGRSYPATGIIATVAVGTIVGLLYFLAVKELQILSNGPLFLLFITWQSAVAATIGRFLR